MSIEHPIRDDIARLDAMRTETRIWSVGSLVAIVVILAVGLLVISGDIHALFNPGPEQNEFASTLGANLNQTVVPQVQQIASQALTQSQPADQAELAKLSQRLPEISSAFMTQVQTLQQDLPSKGESIMQQTFGKSLKDEQPTIEQMFPDVTPANIDSLTDAITQQAQTQLTTTSQSLFSKHVDALKGIISDMRTIESTESVNPSTDKANIEMAMSVVGAFNNQLAGATGGSGASPSAKTTMTSAKPAPASAAAKEKKQ